MKFFITSILLVVCAFSIKAQAPNWTINTRAYEFSMSFTAALNVNGTRLTNVNDKVAAFVGNEIRGVGNISYDTTDDKYVVFFRVYANTINETINFKIYDSTNNVVVNVPKTTLFEIDAIIGGVFQSYSIASPTLSNQANLMDFSFQGISEVSKNINDTTYNFVLPVGTNISSLIPVFTLSENARLFKNFVRQESAVTAQDFTSTITYTVLSADETVTKNYNITVTVSPGSGTITTNLQSTNSNLTKNSIIEIDLTTGTEMLAVNKSSFNVSNALVKSITKQSNTTYKIEIVPLNQGEVQVQVYENVLSDAIGNLNAASNVLSFTYDTVNPFILSTFRDTTLDEVTGSNTVSFLVNFNEDVLNVTANSFESVADANITITKITDKQFKITITNIDEYEGTVFVLPKANNTITDLAENPLRIIKNLDF